MASEKQITDCYWFLQGQCAKGEACEYRHQPEALLNATTCVAWTEGKCKNLACSSRHPSGAQPKARANKSVVCYYFTNGGCMKGSSCPYSHNVEIPEDLNDGDSAVKQLEEMKKKQADELKRLQEERKKEEERLAQLRAQQEHLLQREQQKKKNQEDSQRNERQKNQLKKQKQIGNRAKTGNTSNDKPAVEVLPAPTSTFARSLSDIIKDKKQNRNDNKQARQIKEKLEPKKNQDSKNESQNMDFGVKSLDQLLKEKQEKEKEKPTVSEKQEVDKVKSSNLDSKKTPSRVTELRKKKMKRSSNHQRQCLSLLQKQMILFQQYLQQIHQKRYPNEVEKHLLLQK